MHGFRVLIKHILFRSKKSYVVLCENFPSKYPHGQGNCWKFLYTLIVNLNVFLNLLSD